MSDPRQPLNLPGTGGISLRQQAGNYISIRQAPNQDAGWGTLAAPKHLELPLLPPYRRIACRLGYEAVPSTEVFSFDAHGPRTIRVSRITEDRYGVHVGVALLDADNRRVASLVDTADGVGASHEIPPGRYKIIASLGVAVEVRFELLIELSPGVVLTSTVRSAASGSGALAAAGGLQTTDGTAAADAGWASGRLAPTGLGAGDPGLAGDAAGRAAIAPPLRIAPPERSVGDALLSADAALVSLKTHPEGSSGAVSTLHQAVVVDLPHDPRRVFQQPGEGVSLNAAYLDLPTPYGRREAAAYLDTLPAPGNQPPPQSTQAMSVSASIESALLGWALGTPFPAPPQGLYLSLHSSTACDGSDEIHSWQGGSRITLTSADLQPHPDGGLVNVRALLFGIASSPAHVEGYAVWSSAASTDLSEQLLVGRMNTPVDLAVNNPPLFYAGDLILRAR